MSEANKPAFPIQEEWTPEGVSQDGYIPNEFNGLTKREYFAAKAMGSMMSVITIQDVEGIGTGQALRNLVAVGAVEMADAMLAALEKTK